MAESHISPSSTAPVTAHIADASQLKQQERQPTQFAYGETQDRNDSLGSSKTTSSANHDVEKSAPKDAEKKSEDDEDEEDPNLVDWDGPDDPENPQNWPKNKKWLYTFLLGSTTFVVTFASSVFSTATMPTAMEFNVSPEVMVLGLALFVLGFSFGPIVFGPASELYGRKLPMYVGYIGFAVFNIPVALAHDLQTIFVSRFFGGVFASAPLAIIGGYLADFWSPVERNIAICVFSGATFVGPVLGPVMGGFITQSYLGWRWTQWITLIMAALFGGLAFLIVPESYAPTLLTKKAKKLRFETKNWALHAKAEEQQKTLKSIARTYGLKPFIMLAMEPILVLVTLYISFIYGVIYLFFEAYPITFQEQRGYNLGVGALPFIAIIVGVCMSSAFTVVYTKTRFARITRETGNVIPEERLIPMMLGGALFPIGLFWFAWTSSPNITPWPQIIAGAPIGAGIQLIFMQGLVYLIDVYKMHANSALSANTFVRSFFGAGFPMFATGMYHNLGVPWATSLLGFLAIALFPVPILFYIYGARIRSWSKYAPS